MAESKKNADRKILEQEALETAVGGAESSGNRFRPGQPVRVSSMGNAAGEIVRKGSHDHYLVHMLSGVGVYVVPEDKLLLYEERPDGVYQGPW